MCHIRDQRADYGAGAAADNPDWRFAEVLPLFRRSEANTRGPDALQGPEIETFIRRKAETIYHPVGTCKMGQDAGAVVDAQLRVRGIDGLRVIDASIMPTLVSGNTNAPTVMIAEKASDLILNQYLRAAA